MTAKRQREGAPDAGLSKARVVLEAIHIADREGVEALSMRRLASTLGAGAMSLYHYVASKDELLDAMIDVVFSEIELPDMGADWQTAMRDRSCSARDVLGRHPWAVAIIESRMAMQASMHAWQASAHILQTGLMSAFAMHMSMHSWHIAMHASSIDIMTAGVMPCIRIMARIIVWHMSAQFMHAGAQSIICVEQIVQACSQAAQAAMQALQPTQVLRSMTMA